MSRRTAQRVVLGLLLATGVACDKPAPPPGNDTTAESPSPPLGEVPSPPEGEAPWNPSAGAVFLVIGPNTTTASMVFPSVSADAEVDATRLDTSPWVGRAFDLLGGGGAVSGGTVRASVPVDAPEECSGWPMVQLTVPTGDSATRPWHVGFEQGRVTPVPYDSISALTGADSSRVAMELARLASRVPGDTVAALQGTPYQVRRAYRFVVGAGVEGVVAELRRVLPQEANPLQEHLLLVAERDSASRGRYELAYLERAAGGEETLESSELLAIVRLTEQAAPPDAMLLLARYMGDGVVYAMLERTGARRWRLRWSSPYVGC